MTTTPKETASLTLQIIVRDALAQETARFTVAESWQGAQRIDNFQYLAAGLSATIAIPAAGLDFTAIKGGPNLEVNINSRGYARLKDGVSIDGILVTTEHITSLTVRNPSNTDECECRVLGLVS